LSVDLGSRTEWHLAVPARARFQALIIFADRWTIYWLACEVGREFGRLVGDEIGTLRRLMLEGAIWFEAF
jgi:hypothetical protein